MAQCPRGGVQADGGRGGQVEALRAAVDRHPYPQVSGLGQGTGQAVRLGAEQPRGRHGEAPLVGQRVEVDRSVRVGGQDAQPGRARPGDDGVGIGRTDQVAEPGTYFTADLAGEPLAIVRDGDGVLRAFYNVCRHRAAQVINEPCGQVSKLRCRYHGWTYDLTGRLRGTPEFDGVADFCKEEQGLTPLAVDTWGPLVFVHAPPLDRIQPLAEFLAPLPERFPESELRALHFAGRREYDVACNWKVYVDNYLDGGYHVLSIHPGLAGVLDYAHYRTEVHARTSFGDIVIRRS